MHSRMTLGQLHRASAAIAAASEGLGDAAFFGTSRTMFGFDPAVFDATLADRGHRLTTLNFGLIPNPPTLTRVLANRLCEAHRAAGTRWRLLIVELAAEDWTINAASDGGVGAFEQAIRVMTLDPAAALRGREPGFLVAGRVFGYHAPFAVASGLKKYLYEDLPPKRWVPPPPDWLAAFRRFADLYRPGERGDWRAESRGFVRPGSEAASTAYRDYVQIQSTAVSIERQRADAIADGIIGMNISPEALASSIELIRELGRCPEHVILVMYPIRPTVRSIMPPEARHRRRDALSTIARETGFEVVDLFEDPELGPDQFQDGVHLTVTSGAQLFSRTLATRVADALGHGP